MLYSLFKKPVCRLQGKTILTKQRIFFILFLSFSVILLPSCILDLGSSSGLIQPSLDSPQENDGDRFERETQKESDPEIQERCRDRGHRPCQNNKECKDICDDIFSRSRHLTECERLPFELVQGFEDIFELIKNLNEREVSIRDIQPETLRCLLDINELPFARKLRTLKREHTMDFLSQAASSDSTLGDVLRAEDDEFVMLKELYDNLSNEEDDLKKLAEPVSGQLNIFELIIQNRNQKAYDWVDDFVKRECDNSQLCQRSSGTEKDSFIFYCRLFRSLSSGRLRSVVKSSLFQKHFAKKIEDHTVCESSEDQACDARYVDHFEAVCEVYTSETSL